MDPFTESILARARERQKLIENYGNDKTITLANGSGVTDLKENESASSLNSVSTTMAISHKSPLKESKNFDNNTKKLTSQNSKTRILSDYSPNSEPRTMNIKADNFNMEIKLSSLDNVRLEVEIENKDDDDNSEHTENDGKLKILSNDSSDHVCEGGLRDEAKDRLRRLGKLYSGDDNPDISSPIHKTEAKFYKIDDDIPQERENDTGRKGLKSLIDLAENINQWEDDIKTPRKTSQINNSPHKRGWKPPAPQPPIQKVPQALIHKKYKAPDPPSENCRNSPLQQPTKVVNDSDKKTEECVSNKSSVRASESSEESSKCFDLDEKVLKNLELQGFKRTNSNSRLVYNYNVHKDIKTASVSHTQKYEQKCIPECKESDHEECIPQVKQVETHKLPSSVNSQPSRLFTGSPTKSKIIADKAQIFERASSPKTSKDPALLSLSERKALFEKNKGEALIPKAPFGMAVPVSNLMNKNSVPKQSVIPKKVSSISDSEFATACIPQACGIASKMAALLEGTPTISQLKIENNIREDRRKDMDLLLNRFNRNTPQIQAKPITENNDSRNNHDMGISTSDTVPKSENETIHSQSPASQSSSKPRHSGKRCSKVDSPKVAAVLEDVKRIKVSPAKIGRLYPNLSDIEATTETEPEGHTRTPSPNISSESSSIGSDVGNTSFGREILQVVCKNQTPCKRPVYDDSTASDLSDVLNDMNDEYLDEALAYDGASESPGPTPPKISRQSPPSSNQPQPSNSFHYKSYSPKKTCNKFLSSKQPNFRSPEENRRSSTDLPTFVVDGDNVLPLTHTVSFYRKQQASDSKSNTPKISRNVIVEEHKENDILEDQTIQQKIKDLKEEVNKQQLIISQTSHAINLCSCTLEFMGSTEHVEAERVLLIATHKRQAALNEMHRLSVEKSLRPIGKETQNKSFDKGTLIISNILLPLKKEYVRALSAAGGMGHHVICLLKYCDQVVATKLVSTVVKDIKNPESELTIPGTYKLNVYSNFTITFEVYCLQAQEESLPHDLKYHINNKKGSSKSTPKKSKHDSRLVRPIKESPGGPLSVRSPSFAIMGYVVLSIQGINKKHWTLNNNPSMSPLEGTVEMHLKCEIDISIEHRGFLTMFEDVSGFGAWHRRWCLLKGCTLSYWKYPDDERKVAPIDSLDLRSCITKNVAPVSRDICARLHTFLIECERTAYPTDKNSLVMERKGNKTILKHLLSADTKEERIEWCENFNKALSAIRMSNN